MQFTLVRQTIGGRTLLSSEGGEPVARPVPLLLGRKKVGVIRETIGSVASPFYIAELEQGFDAKKLVGKTLESG